MMMMRRRLGALLVRVGLFAPLVGCGSCLCEGSAAREHPEPMAVRD